MLAPLHEKYLFLPFVGIALVTAFSPHAVSPGKGNLFYSRQVALQGVPRRRVVEDSSNLPSLRNTVDQHRKQGSASSNGSSRNPRTNSSFQKLFFQSSDGDGGGDAAQSTSSFGFFLNPQRQDIPGGVAMYTTDGERAQRELSQEVFGPLLPVAAKVDELSGGWAMSYADVSPETETTPIGTAFLATNLAYALAGLLLTVHGEVFLGTLTEIAGGVSLWYHFSQLKFGQERCEVRLALLTDYFFAATALVTGAVYMVGLGITHIPVECVFTGAVAMVCLSLCWVWEFGVPYIFWHSLWHIFSALTGYLIGQAHLDVL